MALAVGEIRSVTAITEPAVASSDATNIGAWIERDGDHHVIHGCTWRTCGGNCPRRRILIFIGKTDPANPDRHRRQSMALVPMDTAGVTVLRRQLVLGYDNAPEGDTAIALDNVRVPASNLRATAAPWGAMGRPWPHRAWRGDNHG